MKNTKNKGFTLIEILVVIGIIAILAAVVLIAINPARQFAQANNSQRSSNVNAILNAVGQYMADNKGAFPTDINDGTAGTFENIADGASDICDQLVPEYIPALPVDPSTDPDGSGTVYDKGEALKTCPSNWDTGYELDVDADNRITVSAPETQLCTATACPAAEQISVTR